MNFNEENFDEDKKQSEISIIQTKKREDKNMQKEEEKNSLNESVLKNALQSSEDEGKDEKYKGATITTKKKTGKGRLKKNKKSK